MNSIHQSPVALIRANPPCHALLPAPHCTATVDAPCKATTLISPHVQTKTRARYTQVIKTVASACNDASSVWSLLPGDGLHLHTAGCCQE